MTPQNGESVLVVALQPYERGLNSHVTGTMFTLPTSHISVSAPTSVPRPSTQVSSR